MALDDHHVVAAGGGAGVHAVDGEVLRDGADRLRPGRAEVLEDLSGDVHPAHADLGDDRPQVGRGRVEDDRPGDGRAAEVGVVVEARRGGRRALDLQGDALGTRVGQSLLDLGVAQGLANDLAGVGAA